MTVDEKSVKAKPFYVLSPRESDCTMKFWLKFDADSRQNTAIERRWFATSLCRLDKKGHPFGRRLKMASCLFAAAFLAGGVTAVAEDRTVDLLANDYPTAARVDYVFGCMAVNGQTRDALFKCSCAIDVIASILPYAEYEAAETVMSLRLRGGESTAIFSSHAPLRETVKNLKRAQVESELRCF